MTQLCCKTSYVLRFSLGSLYSAASAYTNLKCIISTYTLSTSATKNIYISKPYWFLKLNKRVHQARLEKTELQGSLRKRNSCRAEAGTSTDLPNSAQREFQNLHNLHIQRKGVKSICNPTYTGKTHPRGWIIFAPKNLDSHTNKINGQNFHKWL